MGIGAGSGEQVCCCGRNKGASLMSDVGEAAIRARAEKATPGPWDMDAPSSGRPFEKIVVRNLGGGSQRAYVAQASSPADWEFIAHAREDIPYLLGRVSSLSAQLAESGRAFRDYKISHHENEHEMVALRSENTALRARIDTATAGLEAEKMIAELGGFSGTGWRMDAIIAALTVPTEVEEPGQ
jgi:hypothetical protein